MKLLDNDNTEEKAENDYYLDNH